MYTLTYSLRLQVVGGSRLETEKIAAEDFNAALIQAFVFLGEKQGVFHLLCSSFGNRKPLAKAA